MGTYDITINKTTDKPKLDGDWGGSVWSQANEYKIENFSDKSSDHRPDVRFKLLHDNDAVYVHFKVEDKYVLSRRTEFQGSVCKDSCVEFFVRPVESKGYLNFEINCGGTLLVYFIRDASPGASGEFTDYEKVTLEVGKQVEIYHSLNGPIDPEIEEDTTWYIEYKIPRSVFEHYLGDLGEFSGQTWSANLFKCADESSHPHWGYYAPIGGPLRFHQPQYFIPVNLA